MGIEPGRFLADLHIHSRFSRATSSELTVPSIYRWCQLKGIGLVSTGDFTHAEWMSELQANLVEDGSGFLAMRPEAAAAVNVGVPSQARRDVRFVISGEISSIYKKNGRTRKVHSLVFMPSIASAVRFSTALGRLGNIKSDGRPILGLDPMHILRVAMDADPDAFMIPAHVWTPHFSVFGAMSGFDAIEECFEDMTPYIFALETGLSSDVPMNRRWSALDRFALTSSSDAHSPSKLGREATILEGEVSWKGLVSALKGQAGPTRLAGTVEFFPEEGKYHVDGHRKCNFSCDPVETARLGGRCPVCGGRLTPGVLGRTEQLANRSADMVPDGFPGQVGLIPLAEILAEIKGCGAGSNKVQAAWERLIRTFGGELEILGWMDPAELDTAGEYAMAEALRRMRAGRVFKEAGYDGEYGRIDLFRPGEVEQLQGQWLMFGTGERPVNGQRPACGLSNGASGDLFDPPDRDESVPAQAAPVAGPGDLTEEQAAAVECRSRFVLVVAGPGTGKTRTMVARAAALVERGADPCRILVVTFTNRAAGEAAERLAARMAPAAAPIVSTFHAFALARLVECARVAGRELPVIIPDSVSQDDVPAGGLRLDGLVPALVDELRVNPAAGGGFEHILVDEFQDISGDQYEMLGLLADAGASIFCVGDPDQSIYGFRGAVPQVFGRFAADYPDAAVHVIGVTHRLTPQVAAASSAILGSSSFGSGSSLKSAAAAGMPVVLCRARHARDEASWIASTITAMIGGTDMLDSAPVSGTAGLGDFAVLGRTHQALEPVSRALEAAGLPFERASDAPLWHHDWARVILAAAAASEPLAGFENVARGALKSAGLTPPEKQFRNLIELAAAGECGPASERLAVLTEIDAFGLDPERIHLLTVHASKGLEFDNVFVAGCNDGTVPLVSVGDFDEDEERRLLFVAATRARKRLFLSWAAFGRQGEPRVSRFLVPLDAGGAVKVDAAPVIVHKPVQQSLF